MAFALCTIAFFKKVTALPNVQMLVYLTVVHLTYIQMSAVAADADQEDELPVR